MATVQTLKADMVRSLSTKFFHKNDSLQFQIALHYQDNLHLYKDFDNYTTYRENHDRLVKALNENAQIPDDFKRVK